MKKNEVYLGTQKEIESIKELLQQQRSIIPERFKKHISLKDALSKKSYLIDWNLFQQIRNKAYEYFSTLHPKFTLLPDERYLISMPRSENIGGFYGRPVGGYYYFNDIAFSTLLSEHSTSNDVLRTFEFARNYIHDNMHACTFKTFRLDPNTGLIFRHQYGLNFRNSNRISYSAPNLNEKSPDAINLNTWMDALVHLQANSFLKQNFAKVFDDYHFSAFEREVYNEIFDMTFDDRIFQEPLNFYNEVIFPAKNFIEKWGKEFLFDETLKCMISGDLTPLKNYFDIKFKEENSWEKLFKQSAYKDEY